MAIDSCQTCGPEIQKTQHSYLLHPTSKGHKGKEAGKAQLPGAEQSGLG